MCITSKRSLKSTVCPSGKKINTLISQPCFASLRLINNTVFACSSVVFHSVVALRYGAINMTMTAIAIFRLRDSFPGTRYDKRVASFQEYAFQLDDVTSVTDEQVLYLGEELISTNP